MPAFNLSPRRIGLLKMPLFVAGLLPAANMALAAFGVAGRSLGANPIEELIHRCGWWGLTFLLITLAVTPLRRLSGWNWLLRLRRMFGLFAFFYLCLHFMVYAGLDQRFDLHAIAEDVLKRPYITLGMTGLALMIPLAATSTAGMMRRLGRRWQQLHRLVYLIAVLGCWHFYWQVKKDVLQPSIFAGVLAVLLGFRLMVYWQKRRRSRGGVDRFPATP
jgi:sulfoxide reductase heme-binding subunit YedZ